MTKLITEPREIKGKKVKKLREEGKVPASIFGPKFQSTDVTVDDKAFRGVFDEAGYSNLVDVEIDGGKKKEVGLIKEVQQHPVTDQILHVSIYVVDQKQEISTEVPIVLEGIPPAEDQGVGFLVQAMDTLAIRCLPKDLPSKVTVSVDELAEANQSISVNDIKLPDGVELDPKVDEYSSIAYIGTSQKMEEIEAEAEAAAEAAAAEAAAEAEEDEEGVEDEEGEEGEGEEGAEDQAEQEEDTAEKE